jgi:hypothetical protein
MIGMMILFALKMRGSRNPKTTQTQYGVVLAKRRRTDLDVRVFDTVCIVTGPISVSHERT